MPNRVSRAGVRVLYSGIDLRGLGYECTRWVPGERRTVRGGR